ncbi:MAG: hypothetical protein ACKPKO_05450, partial [Candidatus Fonsibacter sp.]
GSTNSNFHQLWVLALGHAGLIRRWNYEEQIKTCSRTARKWISSQCNDRHVRAARCEANQVEDVGSDVVMTNWVDPFARHIMYHARLMRKWVLEG